MSTTTARKLERIRRYSTSLRRLARFFFVVAILGATVSLLELLLAPSVLVAPINIVGIEFAGSAANVTVRWLAALAIVLGMGLLTKFFFHLIRLLGLYAEGVIFTAESVAHIRQIGVTLLLVPALWLLGPVALLIVGPGPSPDAGISLVSAPIGQLISGIIVILVSWIMDLGRELREEQDLVV